MATDINHITLIGRVTRDVGTDNRNFGYTKTGMCRAMPSIAVNRAVKKEDKWEEDVSYFDVVIWGKTAENLKPYLTKGKQIAVSGYLRQERWEKDGQKNSKVVIVADSVQLIGGNGSGNQNTAPQGQASNPPEQDDFDAIPF